MRDELNQPQTALLLSGGIDSAVLLDQLLDRCGRVVPCYVRTGCVWQAAELSAVNRLLAAVARPGLSELVALDMRFDDLYGDHWSLSGTDVPDDQSPDEAVYLPGRNPLLLIKPSIWCQMHGIGHLVLATLASNPFPDATPAFFARFEAMLQEAMHGQLQIARPFENLSKKQVLEMGRHLPLQFTFSCLSPVRGLHCGHCNKCAERRRAFQDVGIDDPTAYAPTGANAGLSRSASKP